ncbi:dienelactone hydrolase family protein [Tunturibacter empetritectus]|uniref:Dienelactone hydrolase family protein n=1 Tax=Tunturiibacter empetritectus TaxID=3069691 RepID=A0AAU7ZBM4_9BACT
MKRRRRLPFRTIIGLAICFLAVGKLSLSQRFGVSLATSQDGRFKYEIFGKDDPGKPLMILLHGASGPGVGFYREQAEYFSNNGYTVLLPHYFDATKSNNPTIDNYRAWVNVVKSLMREQRTTAASDHRKSVLVGYSLGASVALAAGSQEVPVDAIAEWYGSLPDDFFEHLQGMPPLLILHGERDTNIPVGNAQQLIKLCEIKQFQCESHIYPDQGHGFTGAALKDADSRTLSFFSR